MDPHTVTGTALAAAEAANYSLVALFMKADIVVKCVMGGLALASIWSWAIIFDKGFKLGGIRSRAGRFEDLFWSGRPLDDLYKRVENRPDHPLAVVFIAAMREWRRTLERRGELTNPSGLVGRINVVMQASIAREISKLQRHMNFLATLASSAPFIGLFGTVWGIMNAFERIGITQSTSLAVVAPAIAEALMATGLGLAAAIPALIFYNRYSNAINEYTIRLDGFADEFSAILSRQLEEKAR
jgi:biopolymer transport protein TolQ